MIILKDLLFNYITFFKTCVIIMIVIYIIFINLVKCVVILNNIK